MAKYKNVAQYFQENRIVLFEDELSEKLNKSTKYGLAGAAGGALLGGPLGMAAGGAIGYAGGRAKDKEIAKKKAHQRKLALLKQKQKQKAESVEESFTLFER
jgi:hypothetical protein